MIPGSLLSAFPHRQFHTLPGLLDSWAAMPNSYPNACMPMQRGNLYHFYDGLWYDPAERRTHDLPCERRTRYRLSQPDTLQKINLRDFYIFGILRTSRFHFCVIAFNKGGGILICIFPKWPPRLSNTQKLSHIATCTNISLLIFC